MRKSSVQLVTQTSEPLIVVDEDKDGERKDEDNSSESSSEDSPASHFQNQFLLSPWRDARETRKLSLPSPQCSGITASQVRRLSERGETGAGPGPRQTEFLATLCQTQGPIPSGRRHSVVTICKLPSAPRSRRESVAVCGPGRLLGSRRESAVGPPSTEPRGSVHNLQLDIMDDIVQSRKVRLKMWNTSNERVCEVKDEAGAVQKYTGNRRYSDFVGTTLAPIPSSSRRRASELPPTPLHPSTTTPVAVAAEEATRKQARAPGIVCSNTDLISILSNLTASATEIDQCARQPTKEETRPHISVAASTSCASTSATASKVEKKGWETRRARLRTNRSNSFDASVLHQVQDQSSGSEWFARRHQPMAAKESSQAHAQTTNTKPNETEAGRKSPKVVWDDRSGSVVDAHVLGNAIEDFLRRDSQQSLVSQPPAKKSPQAQAKPKGWFASARGQDADEAGPAGATCDSSICATLKDLFVK
ncbi:uncharacterized protein [Atheta coriaria]|uniref:uncharacterized protein n=1 Tax=Dalotia coriaria TaxID=877792 RepID=UPI0031F3E649